MRKEAVLFVASIMIATALFGPRADVGLFIFGFAWLCKTEFD
jgi:hypothetical protein